MIFNEDNGFYHALKMMCLMTDNQAKNILPSIQYDSDTVLGIPNFIC